MADGDKVLPEFSGKGQKEGTTDREKFYFYSPLSLFVWIEYFMDHLVDFLPAGSVTNHSSGLNIKDQVCLKQTWKNHV